MHVVPHCRSVSAGVVRAEKRKWSLNSERGADRPWDCAGCMDRIFSQLRSRLDTGNVEVPQRNPIQAVGAMTPAHVALRQELGVAIRAERRRAGIFRGDTIVRRAINGAA